MSIAMQTVCASAPVDDWRWLTIELQCTAWAESLWLVQAFDEDGAQQFTLETGEVVTFAASPMGISLPDVTARGSQDLTLQLDNVTAEALYLIDQAIDAESIITVVFREYVESNHAAPARGPFTMTVTNTESTMRYVQCSASFANFLDAEFPPSRITAAKAPGLSYQ